MKNLLFLFTALSMVFFFGCNRNSAGLEDLGLTDGYVDGDVDDNEVSYDWQMGDGSVDKNSKTIEVQVGNTGQSTSEPKVQAPNHDAKIIRTADIGMQLDNYAKDKYFIYDAVKASGGYISKEDERNETYRISNSFQIRVPVDEFDKFLEIILTGNGIKNIDYKRVNARDVGEEYADVSARIRTKKAVEEQYIEILKRAKTIPDILNVKEQIRQIREEIESNEGRLRWLSKQVTYSTVNLSVYQTLESGNIIERPGFFNKLKNALQTGWNGLLQMFLVLAYLWPLWIGIFLIVFLIRRRGGIRKMFSRKKS